jgi:hypothetical protein
LPTFSSFFGFPRIFPVHFNIIFFIFFFVPFGISVSIIALSPILLLPNLTFQYLSHFLRTPTRPDAAQSESHAPSFPQSL